jgi:hypothetical protein
VNKKKQKNFANLGRAGFAGTGPTSKKFLRRFFQKAASFFCFATVKSPKIPFS